MADILSQEEVDLLLSAVSDGDIDEAVDAAVASEGPVFTSYDFRRPERVSKEQLKGLQSIFEAFTREIGIILPPFLRTMVRIDLVSIDQLTYDEFILSVARPTSLSTIDMSPLEGRAVLEMGPAMVFPIVDRVLGGKGVALSQQRELTEIEEGIVYRIVLMILDSWKRAWEKLIEMDMKVVGQESDPLIVQIVEGSEMVILLGFKIYIGESVGSMNICIPLMVLNPILDQISSQTHFQREMSKAVASQTRAALTHSVVNSKIAVEPILGQTTLSLEDVARLQVGDVVTLGSKHNMPIDIRVGGVPRFTGLPGKKGEQSSVQIISLIQD
ncbi:MAG: flagellar motor switch protein FliM [Candidatus Hydrogenedentota bacterium]